MKSKLALSLVAILFVGVWAVFAQSADWKQYKKDGLTVNYPSNWQFNDTSNADAQQLQLGRDGSDAQITVFVFRTPITSPEQMAEAKRVLVDPYVASTANTFKQMGANPQTNPANVDIAGVKADGSKITASLDGEPGAAEIYWAVLGKRLVVLTFFGPEKATKQAAPAWDLIRTSIAVEEPSTQPKPTPKATPKP